MAYADGRRPPAYRTVLRGVLPALVVMLCLLPHAPRLREPSLVGDDIMRVEDLQTHTLPALWFRPFNEHMAPIFETVSWVAWRCAGRRLAAAPWTFTAASFVPFVLCLGALGSLVRRAFGSDVAAGLAVVLFTM